MDRRTAGVGRAARRGRPPVRLSWGLALVTLTLAGTLGACGSSDSGSGTAAEESTTTGPPTTPTTTPPAAPAAPTGLAGSTWTLSSYVDAEGETVPAAPVGSATLTFAEEGALSGTTGCNNFTGTATVEGSDLTIELGATTQMACTDEVLQAQETAITTGMAAVTSFTNADETLVLSGADGALFTYAATNVSIDGEWKVTGINNGKEAVETNETVETLTATFADGEFSGFGGCNQLTGGYTITGTGGIEIGPLGQSMMACEGDPATVEAQYSAALQAAATYEIIGTTLTLRDEAGATQVTATRAG